MTNGTSGERRIEEEPRRDQHADPARSPVRIAVIGAGTAATTLTLKTVEQLEQADAPYQITLVDKADSDFTRTGEPDQVIPAHSEAAQNPPSRFAANVVTHYHSSHKENLRSLNAGPDGSTREVQGGANGGGAGNDQFNRAAPNRSDYERNAVATGDPSLRYAAMIRHRQEVTAVQYHGLVRKLQALGRGLGWNRLANLGGIGFKGRIPVSVMHPSLVANDPQLSVMAEVTRDLVNKHISLRDRVLRFIGREDPNISFTQGTEGVVNMPLALRPDGRRANPFDVLAARAQGNESLNLIGGATVMRINTEDAGGVRHATGVHYRTSANDEHFLPADIVVNAAGAIHGPRIALSSGFGALEKLMPYGVEQVAALEGVGGTYGGRAEMGVKVRFNKPLLLTQRFLETLKKPVEQQLEGGRNSPASSTAIFPPQFQLKFPIDGVMPDEPNVIVAPAHFPFLGYTNNPKLPDAVGRVFDAVTRSGGELIAAESVFTDLEKGLDLLLEEDAEAKGDAKKKARENLVQASDSLMDLAAFYEHEGGGEAIAARLVELAKPLAERAQRPTDVSQYKGRFDPNVFDPNVMTFIVIVKNDDIQGGTVDIDPSDPYGQPTLNHRYDRGTSADKAIRQVMVPAVKFCLDIVDGMTKRGLVDRVIFPPADTIGSDEKLGELFYDLVFNHHPRGGLAQGHPNNWRTVTDSEGRMLGTDNIWNASAAIQGPAFGNFIEKGVEEQANLIGDNLAQSVISGEIQRPAQKANDGSIVGKVDPATIAVPDARKLVRSAAHVAKSERLITNREFMVLSALCTVERLIKRATAPTTKREVQIAWNVINRVLEWKPKTGRLDRSKLGSNEHTVAHNLLFAIDATIQAQKRAAAAAAAGEAAP